jgi:biuret amidohydrolase
MRGTIAWQQPGPEAITSLEIDLEHTGLLAIDLQYACASPEHGFPGNERPWQPDTVREWGEVVRGRVLPNVERLLAWFRARQLPLVHTRVGSYLPSGRDLHARRRLSNLRHKGGPPFQCAFGDPIHAIVDDVAPLEGELVIDKNASGAFVGSGIDFSLRGLELQTLVACGIATHACVQHTVRDAADLGYNVILVSDACFSSPGNDVEHERTLRVFGSAFGAVKTTNETIAALETIEHASVIAR